MMAETSGRVTSGIFPSGKVASTRGRLIRPRLRVTKWAVRRLSSVVKSPAVQRALYRSGALHAYHRRRNRDRLTVVMFHRVLAPTDPRWATADPEYSLRDDLFAECLSFFRRHYHVVGLDDLLAARSGERPLPPRPLLLTFDDGWSDTEEFALPHLRLAGMPALLFVVADVVGRREPFFQERMVGAWRAGRLDAPRAGTLWRDLGGDPARAPAFGGRDDLEPLRELIERLEALAPADRDRLLAPLGPALDDGVRHMVTADQLRNLAGHRVAIGAHGKTHAPLTRATDLDVELSGARTALAGHVGSAPITLSCPHGAHDPRVVGAAHAAGYELVFTSVPELAPAAGSGPAALGRIGFTGETITDAHGRFAPERLALHLFRKPHAAQPGLPRPQATSTRDRSIVPDP